MGMRSRSHIVRILSLITILPLILFSSAAHGKPEIGMPVNYDSVKETISRLIKKEMRKNDVAGLSIALVDDQQVVWAQGFGYADEQREIPATPDTVYRIGSLTKLFTVSAAMQLAEQGRLNIDQPLKNYLPEFSILSRFNGAGPITLRHLMTHHAGLPSNLQKGMWSRKPEPFENVVNALKDEYAAYPPGYIFSYSNVGMTLLGHVVERVSGRDYDSYIRESLFQPMNMTRTGFSSSQKTDGLVSKGYHKGKEMEDPLVRDVPAGGMQSTVLDLSRFMQMMFSRGRSNGHQILKPGTLEEMLRPQNADVPLDLGLHIGLGWMLSGLGNIDIQNAGTVAHHAGATLMFHSQMIVLPEHKLGVVVLANSSTASRVVGKTAVRALILALEAKAGIKQPAQTTSAESDVPLTREVLQDGEGLYASILGVVEIKAKVDHFHVKFMNRTLQLEPLADGRFCVKYRLFGLFPLSLGELDNYEISRTAVAGREILTASTKGRELLIAEKIRPVPVPEAWSNRAGEYRISNLGDDFPLMEEIRLRYDDGLLFIECAVPLFFKGTVRFPLKPVSDTEAIIAGLGRGLGETITAVTINGNEALVYSGYHLTKLR